MNWRPRLYSVFAGTSSVYVCTISRRWRPATPKTLLPRRKQFRYIDEGRRCVVRTTRGKDAQMLAALLKLVEANGRSTGPYVDDICGEGD